MADLSEPLYAVIMAGGRGERFWPLGRKSRPKQLLSLTDERTMIENTLNRLTPLLPPERILVLTNRDYVEPIRSLLPLPPENVIGEPVARDTAPCAALAAALIRRRNPAAETTMLLLPSDQEIRDGAELRRVLRAAAARAARGELVTIGIRPDSPNTGFGYLELGAELTAEPVRFYQVKAFREKPDPETAKRFLEAGNFRWNSGIFVWRTGDLLRAFRRFAPELATMTEQLCAVPDSEFSATLERLFPACPRISIDYAVMEKADHIVAAEATFDWDDVGSWNSVRQRLQPDDAGNAVRGTAELVDCRNCLVVGDSDHLIGAIGVEDLVIVTAGNATLVCPRNRVQEVKKLVQAVAEAKHGDRYL